MLICVLGNLASGKTTVCYALNKHLQYKLIILDEYRIKYNKKCPREGEIKAQLELMKNLNEKNIILECTGVGRWFTDYLLQYSLRREAICLHLSKERVVATFCSCSGSIMVGGIFSIFFAALAMVFIQFTMQVELQLRVCKLFSGYKSQCQTISFPLYQLCF